MVTGIPRTTRDIGLLTAIVAIAFCSLASAQTYNAEQRRLCVGDAFRLCSSAIPDVDQITVCMRKQKTSLSSGCKAVFDRPIVSAAATGKIAQSD